MTSFAKCWAVKTYRSDINTGDIVPVSLKSGKTKQVKLGAFLYSKGTRDGGTVYFYLPDGDNSDE